MSDAVSRSHASHGAEKSSPPIGFDRGEVETRARAIADKVADKCHGSRKPGQAPERYALIWQAARLGALEVIGQTTSPNKGTDQ